MCYIFFVKTKVFKNFNEFQTELPLYDLYTYNIYHFLSYQIMFEFFKKQTFRKAKLPLYDLNTCNIYSSLSYQIMLENFKKQTF